MHVGSDLYNGFLSSLYTSMNVRICSRSPLPDVRLCQAASRVPDADTRMNVRVSDCSPLPDVFYRHAISSVT